MIEPADFQHVDFRWPRLPAARPDGPAPRRLSTQEVGYEFRDPDALGNFFIQGGEDLRPGIALQRPSPTTDLERLLKRILLLGQSSVSWEPAAESLAVIGSGSWPLCARPPPFAGQY